jgi:hypothetical protein
MTVVAKRTNKPDYEKSTIVQNTAPSDISVAEQKMYKQAPVITLQNSVNPMAPVASTHMEAQVKNTKTVESGRADLGPIASTDSPTLVGNPEVPLKEDGK